MNPLSTTVLLLMCLGLRAFLMLSEKWRLLALPIIGVRAVPAVANCPGSGPFKRLVFVRLFF